MPKRMKIILTSFISIIFFTCQSNAAAATWLPTLRRSITDLQEPQREVCPTAAGRICPKGYTCFDLFPEYQESWVPRTFAICVQNGIHLAPNEDFRECKPPRCLESTLAKPIIVQQQLNNLRNSSFAGETKDNNPSHCLAFCNDAPTDHVASGDAGIVAEIWNYIVGILKGGEITTPDCCWTANHNSTLPKHLNDLVTVYPTGEITINYDGINQVMVPFMSPYQNSIQFWLLPFKEECLPSIRIEFAFADHNHLAFGQDHSTLCHALVIDGNQIRRSWGLHYVNITNSVMTVTNMGTWGYYETPNVFSTPIDCPVNLRSWPESKNQSYLPFRLLNAFDGIENGGKNGSCKFTLLFGPRYYLLVEDGLKTGDK